MKTEVTWKSEWVTQFPKVANYQAVINISLRQEYVHFPYDWTTGRYEQDTEQNAATKKHTQNIWVRNHSKFSSSNV
jgi:hypothetical protein